MRKICSILIVVLLVITSAVGCGNDGYEDINIRFKDDVFHADFTKAQEFYLIHSDIEAYYNNVITAYNKSDKRDPDTFILPDYITEFSEKLDGYLAEDTSITKEQRYVGLKLKEPYIETNNVIQNIKTKHSNKEAENASAEFEKLKSSILKASEKYKSAVDFTAYNTENNITEGRIRLGMTKD